MQLDSVVAVLNDYPFEFVAIEVDDVARLTLRFLCVRPFAFVEFYERHEGCDNDKQNKRRLEFHRILNRLGATLPPNGKADDRGNERHQNKNKQTHICERLLGRELKVRVFGIFGAMPMSCSRFINQFTLAETKSSAC